MADDYLFAQGQAKPANAEDLQKDAAGITDPNLHRRFNIESELLEEVMITEDNFMLAIDDEFVLSSIIDEPLESPYSYVISVQSLNSYRTTQTKVHDEENNEEEIP